MLSECVNCVLLILHFQVQPSTEELISGMFNDEHFENLL